jgi:hypothetical protein
VLTASIVLFSKDDSICSYLLQDSIIYSILAIICLYQSTLSSRVSIVKSPDPTSRNFDQILQEIVPSEYPASPINVV